MNKMIDLSTSMIFILGFIIKICEINNNRLNNLIINYQL